MSVIIKKMDMPENCDECRMKTDWYFCAAMPEEFCGFVLDDGKPHWCPLIEIPEGSNLIDANKMCEDLATVDPQYKRMVDWCIRVTKAQPVIFGEENYD